MFAKHDIGGHAAVIYPVNSGSRYSILLQVAFLISVFLFATLKMANPYPFQDKVIVVSGASRGTGLALSRHLLVRGAKVSMAATSEENLKKAIAGIEQDIPDVKDRVIYFPTDVRNPDDVKAWIEGTVAKWGELDGAANVAGGTISSRYLVKDTC